MLSPTPKSTKNKYKNIENVYKTNKKCLSNINIHIVISNIKVIKKIFNFNVYFALTLC